MFSTPDKEYSPKWNSLPFTTIMLSQPVYKQSFYFQLIVGNLTIQYILARFMPRPSASGGVIMFSDCPSVRGYMGVSAPSVQVYISWVSGNILIQLVTVKHYQVQKTLITSIRSMVVQRSRSTNDARKHLGNAVPVEPEKGFQQDLYKYLV